MNTLYSIVVIAIIALITFFLRAVPFLLLGGREPSRTVRYLGDALPPAIMIVLVVYCLRGINLTQFPFGLCEIISLAAAAALQAWRKNMYLSITVGTVLYMILIRTI